jgi:hypothetical protein
MSTIIKPEIIFELGRLQVYHYPPEGVKQPPKDVFWQDTVSRHAYGPFTSTYEAMAHYTWIVSTQSKSDPKTDNNANVIYMDFVRRRRIEFGVP